MMTSLQGALLCSWLTAHVLPGASIILHRIFSIWGYPAHLSYQNRLELVRGQNTSMSCIYELLEKESGRNLCLQTKSHRLIHAGSLHFPKPWVHIMDLHTPYVWIPNCIGFGHRQLTRNIPSIMLFCRFFAALTLLNYRPQISKRRPTM